MDIGNSLERKDNSQCAYISLLTNSECASDVSGLVMRAGRRRCVKEMETFGSEKLS